MKDRDVEFPRRYRIDWVPGTDNIADFTPAPGEVSEEGTFYNKANQLSDDTAVLAGLDPADDPTVNDALGALAKRSLPPGGTAGQVLKKRTNENYATYWGDFSGGGSGSVLTIAFDPEFAGLAYSVSDGSDTVTGIVPEELVASVNVINIGSTYTIKSEVDGREHSTTVTTGPYFGRYTAVLKYANVYGVHWSGGPETTLSRTDDAEGFLDPDPFVNDGKHPGRSPFDNLMPWAGMKIVNDPVLGKIVSVPKYWYKWTKSGAVTDLKISNVAKPGFFVSPAHADRGDGQGERDVVYVGRYHCNANYKSVSGALPRVDITRDAARKGIAALDPSAWQYDFAMYWTIMMLYLVEFADWNVQKTIGYGCGNNSAVQACGASDNMGYHTGTMQNSRSTYGVGCQYRYIEGLWDNCFDWVDGIYFSGANVYCIKNPNSFSDTANGTLTGTRQTSSDYIKAWGIPTASGFEWALYPSQVGGSDSAYVPDFCNCNSYGVVFLAGGGYDQYQSRGLFYFGGGNAASSQDAIIGCRLMKLPNKEEE